jgi:hypothetical protein
MNHECQKSSVPFHFFPSVTIRIRVSFNVEVGLNQRLGVRPKFSQDVNKVTQHEQFVIKKEKKTRGGVVGKVPGFQQP